MARSYAFGVTLTSSPSWPSWASANSLDSSCLLRASRSADLRWERSQVLDRGCANFLELRYGEVLRINLPRTRVNRGQDNDGLYRERAPGLEHAQLAAEDRHLTESYPQDVRVDRSGVCLAAKDRFYGIEVRP